MKSKGKNWEFVKTINLENLGCLTIREDKMSEKENIEKWTLEDGRRVEKIVIENKLGDEVERIIEVRVDEERPANIQQKIIERIKPVVYERVIENLDVKTGTVIDEKIEKIDLELKEKHFSTMNFVTKQEMVDAIVSTVKSIKTTKPNELKSLGAIDAIEAKPEKISAKDLFLLGVIILQVIGLVYLVFFF